MVHVNQYRPHSPDGPHRQDAGCRGAGGLACLGGGGLCRRADLHDRRRADGQAVAALGPDVTDPVAVGQGVLGVQHQRVEAIDPASARDRGDHGGPVPDLGLLDQSPGEDGAENALMAEVPVKREFPLGMEDRHLGTGPRAAGTAVDGAGPGGGVVPG